MLRNHENKLKGKTKNNRNKEKSLSTQFTAVLTELTVEYEYDTKFWCKLFHSFTELATSIDVQQHYNGNSRCSPDSKEPYRGGSEAVKRLEK